jgi:hypothetical protein
MTEQGCYPLPEKCSPKKYSMLVWELLLDCVVELASFCVYGLNRVFKLQRSREVLPCLNGT